MNINWHKLFLNILIIPCVVRADFNAVSGLISKYLPQNPIIVEAGAHDGSDTVKMSRFWPQGQIHAFEPVDRLHELLSGKITSRSNVKTYKLALGSHNGKAQFHVSSVGDGSSSLRAPKEHLNYHKDVKFENTIEVEVTTLDTWAAQRGISTIDFLWLDMQGCEFETLVASPHIFSTVKIIYTEVNFIELYEGCVLYPDYKAWLERNGFVEIYQSFCPDAGNALFVRK